MIKGFPDYAPSSAKPWDCKTLGNQRVGAFRRLFALSVASIPARVSTDSHLPRTCTTCSKRGFTGGLARYVWLRMVRNQENVRNVQNAIAAHFLFSSVQYCRLLQHVAANATPSRSLKYSQYRLTAGLDA